MKKIIALLLGLILILPFGACGASDNIDSGISEIRMDIYEGRGDFFEVNIFIGKRESPYSINGISESLVDYCLISVMPAEALEGESGLNFTLTGGGYNGSGTLKEDPASGRFRIDLGKYNAGVSELNITLFNGEFTESVIVYSKYTADMIRWKDALNIAKENLSQHFESAFPPGETKGEIFIRFVNNPLMGDDKYYWFVMLKSADGTTSSVLIDCLTSAVVAKNIL